MIAAVIVERSSCDVERSSLRGGSLILNIERVLYRETIRPVTVGGRESLSEGCE